MDPACPWCGEGFTPTTSRQKFCKRACQQNFNRDRPDKPRCSAVDCIRPARAKGLCNTHCKSRVPRPPDRMTDARRANLRRKTQLRRARLMGDVEAEPIDRNEIGDRDGWRCGLCSLRIDRLLPWPDPQSASLDHIEPLSLGGKHIKSNVQIAHLTCNVVKGNRGGGEQLLLIG